LPHHQPPAPVLDGIDDGLLYEQVVLVKVHGVVLCLAVVWGLTAIGVGVHAITVGASTDEVKRDAATH
jgi:hypothetical protein